MATELTWKDALRLDPQTFTQSALLFESAYASALGLGDRLLAALPEWFRAGMETSPEQFAEGCERDLTLLQKAALTLAHGHQVPAATWKDVDRIANIPMQGPEVRVNWRGWLTKDGAVKADAVVAIPFTTGPHVKLALALKPVMGLAKALLAARKGQGHFCICRQCGRVFTARNSNAETCGGRCRLILWKAQQAKQRRLDKAVFL